MRSSLILCYIHIQFCCLAVMAYRYIDPLNYEFRQDIYSAVSVCRETVDRSWASVMRYKETSSVENTLGK